MVDQCSNLIQAEHIRIQRLLGRGGFAAVYQGFYERPGELMEAVAVKVLQPSQVNGILSEEQYVQMFLREAACTKLQQHPHIIRCFGVCRIPAKHSGILELTKEAWAIVLELAEPHTLRSLIVQSMTESRRVYTNLQAYGWLIQVASALAHLHGNKPPIIHRDLKQENVLLVKRRTDPRVGSGSHGSKKPTKVLEARLADLGLHVVVEPDRSAMLRRKTRPGSSNRSGFSASAHSAGASLSAQSSALTLNLGAPGGVGEDMNRNSPFLVVTNGVVAGPASSSDGTRADGSPAPSEARGMVGTAAAAAAAAAAATAATNVTAAAGGVAVLPTLRPFWPLGRLAAADGSGGVDVGSDYGGSDVSEPVVYDIEAVCAARAGDVTAPVSSADSPPPPPPSSSLAAAAPPASPLERNTVAVLSEGAAVAASLPAAAAVTAGANGGGGGGSGDGKRSWQLQRASGASSASSSVLDRRTSPAPPPRFSSNKVMPLGGTTVRQRTADATTTDRMASSSLSSSSPSPSQACSPPSSSSPPPSPAQTNAHLQPHHLRNSQDRNDPTSPPPLTQPPAASQQPQPQPQQPLLDTGASFAHNFPAGPIPQAPSGPRGGGGGAASASASAASPSSVSITTPSSSPKRLLGAAVAATGTAEAAPLPPSPFACQSADSPWLAARHSPRLRPPSSQQSQPAASSPQTPQTQTQQQETQQPPPQPPQQQHVRQDELQHVRQQQQVPSGPQQLELEHVSQSLPGVRRQRGSNCGGASGEAGGLACPSAPALLDPAESFAALISRNPQLVQPVSLGRSSLATGLRPVRSLLAQFQQPELPLLRRSSMEWVYGLTGRAGSCMYMAPEVFCNLPYNEKADTFSFAVLMYELLARELLIVSYINTGRGAKLGIKQPDDYAAKVSEGFRPPRPACLPDPAWDLVELCWRGDPVARPGMAEVLVRLQALAQQEAEQPSDVKSAGCAGGCVVM